MKLHWCCGDIYLEGYVNLDTKGTIASILFENPNKTTIENYYACPFEQAFGKRQRREFIVDMPADILRTWPFMDASVEEIVMISCWEHFTQDEIQHIKAEIKRVLRAGGKLIVDFPDLRKDIELYIDTDPEYCMELIYCNWKNEYSQHKWGYTPASFARLWPQWQFTVTEKTIVQHDYPMIGMEVVKIHG